ncbi:hypothetical protein EDD86DRAFT_273906 [Gorgonomyces haynaldii]|nr:hypothetical protein EDD86DRAFT_273906 [Gorgonomyces haynaldii]
MPKSEKQALEIRGKSAIKLLPGDTRLFHSGATTLPMLLLFQAVLGQSSKFVLTDNSQWVQGKAQTITLQVNMKSGKTLYVDSIELIPTTGAPINVCSGKFSDGSTCGLGARCDQVVCQYTPGQTLTPGGYRINAAWRECNNILGLPVGCSDDDKLQDGPIYITSGDATTTTTTTTAAPRTTAIAPSKTKASASATPTASDAASTANNQQDAGLTIGAIAGIIAAIVVLLALGGFLYYRAKNASKPAKLNGNGFSLGRTFGRGPKTLAQPVKAYKVGQDNPADFPQDYNHPAYRNPSPHVEYSNTDYQQTDYSAQVHSDMTPVDYPPGAYDPKAYPPGEYPQDYHYDYQGQYPQYQGHYDQYYQGQPYQGPEYQGQEYQGQYYGQQQYYPDGYYQEYHPDPLHTEAKEPPKQ